MSSECDHSRDKEKPNPKPAQIERGSSERLLVDTTISIAVGEHRGEAAHPRHSANS